MGGVISTLAGIIYHGERERRKIAEEKLARYEEIAPDVVLAVRHLRESVESMREEQDDDTSRDIRELYNISKPRRRRTR